MLRRLTVAFRRLMVVGGHFVKGERTSFRILVTLTHWGHRRPPQSEAALTFSSLRPRRWAGDPWQSLWVRVEMGVLNFNSIRHEPSRNSNFYA
jgi:hypothetical protein